MGQIAQVEFIDKDSNDQAVAIVRAGEGWIALTLSLSSDGDVQVVMSTETCMDIVAALKKAVEAAENE